MKSRIIIYTAALMLWILQAGKADAQSLSDNGIFYHSFSSPWAYSLNPALFPKGVSSYTTLPRTNINVSLPFSYSDLGIQYDNERQVAVMNITDFLNKMYERKFRTKRAKHTVNLGVCNVTNHFNPFMLYYDAQAEGWKMLALLPIMPNFNWRLEL